MTKAAAWWMGASDTPPIIYDFVLWNSSRKLQGYSFNGSVIAPVGLASSALPAGIDTAGRGGVSALTGSTVVVSGSDLAGDKAIGKYVFTAGAWALEGNILTTNPGDFIMPAGLGEAKAAINDFANLRFYEFDGTDWAQLNASSGVSMNTLDARTDASVVLINSSNQIFLYEWNGLLWTGSKSSHLGYSALALCSMTASRVAIIDGGSRLLRAYDEGVSGYTQVGNTYALQDDFTTGSLCALAADKVVLGDVEDSSLRVLQFDGTNWTQAGSTYNGANVPSNNSLANGTYLLI